MLLNEGLDGTCSRCAIRLSPPALRCVRRSPPPPALCRWTKLAREIGAPLPLNVLSSAKKDELLHTQHARRDGAHARA
jgi:hypothetical protein